MECYKIENLTFKYPASKSFALRDFSLTINRGEFVTVCGHSGSGKSTLLRLLKPSLSPKGEKTGEILFCGEGINQTVSVIELDGISRCLRFQTGL